MLYEYDVVRAVSKHLKSCGYAIEQECRETQNGDDLIVLSPCKTFKVHIEAKGETSSKEGSKRYNKPFNGSQVRDHVANAFYRAAQMRDREEPPKKYVGVAFPKNDSHVKTVKKIEKSLRDLGIEVFWVTNKKHVECVGNWQ